MTQWFIFAGEVGAGHPELSQEHKSSEKWPRCPMTYPPTMTVVHAVSTTKITKFQVGKSEYVVKKIMVGQNSEF